MGDSSPLVRGTLRMSAFCLSAPEEMAIWFEGGELGRARLTRLPPLAGGGDALRLRSDMMEGYSVRLECMKWF
jgi:hypothetical protein